MTRAVIAIAALAFVGCTTAPPQKSLDAATIEKAEAAGLECRDLPKPGSRRSRTICASEADWARYDEDQRESAEALRDDIRRDIGRSNAAVINSLP